MMIEPVDYTLKFNQDFLSPILEEIKTSTIRANSKPLNIGDICYAYFPEGTNAILVKITDHYAKKVQDLNKDDAFREGYLHEDLLKHELHNIYPDLKDNDYVYIYKFEGIKDKNVKGLLDEFVQEQTNERQEEWTGGTDKIDGQLHWRRIPINDSIHYRKSY